MGDVIEIKFSRDLPTRKQNELRHRMELGVWKRHWREAERTLDYDWMDRLNNSYEMVGLP